MTNLSVVANVCQGDKSSFWNSRQSQKGYSDYKPKLWYSHKKITLKLWYKINYISHRWRRKPDS